MVGSAGSERPQTGPDPERPSDDSRSPQRPAAAEQPDFVRSLMSNAAMWRLAGAGMELGGSAILFAAIGYAVDRYFENTTLIATAIGTVFGFAAGLYRFIRMAAAAGDSSKRH